MNVITKIFNIIFSKLQYFFFIIFNKKKINNNIITINSSNYIDENTEIYKFELPKYQKNNHLFIFSFDGMNYNDLIELYLRYKDDKNILVVIPVIQIMTTNIYNCNDYDKNLSYKISQNIGYFLANIFKDINFIVSDKIVEKYRFNIEYIDYINCSHIQKINYENLFFDLKNFNKSFFDKYDVIETCIQGSATGFMFIYNYFNLGNKVIKSPLYIQYNNDTYLRDSNAFMNLIKLMNGNVVFYKNRNHILVEELYNLIKDKEYYPLVELIQEKYNFNIILEGMNNYFKIKKSKDLFYTYMNLIIYRDSIYLSDKLPELQKSDIVYQHVRFIK